MKNFARGLGALMLSALLMLGFFGVIVGAVALIGRGHHVAGTALLMGIVGFAFYKLGQVGPDNLGV